MALYLTGMFLLWVWGANLPLCTLCSFALMAFFPIALYRTLRTTARLMPQVSVTNLWTQGITTVFCGALVSALVIMVYLKWVNPSYISDQLLRAVETYRSTPDPSLEQAATMAQTILERRAVPPPATWTVTYWLFTVASGSILAGLMAILAKSRKSHVKN